MASPKVDSPFVGLVPYTEDDAEFFFGRARDQQRILANLFAARLSILYGASGVGKSSVLRAGIIKEVRQRIEHARELNEEPEVAAVYFKDWKGDTLARLRAAIGTSLQGLLGKDLVSDLPATHSLKQLLMAIGERFQGDLLLILDQFEEYFLYRPDPHPDEFALEFAEAANQSGLPASFLVALRDDAVTRLDRFKPLIPNLFANYLRLDHLTGEDARRAIEEPILRYNQLPRERKQLDGNFSIEPELTAAVIEQVRTGRVLIGQVGQGKLAGAGAAVAVETPYLQLVMTRLWQEEVRLGSSTLRRETLQKLGGADTIVKSHLETALAGLSKADCGLCARIFPHLVTPSGTKIAHTVGNLTRFAKVSPERLTPLLEQLAGFDKRILAPVAPPDGEPGQLQYEIYHDSLAQAVLAWQARFEEAQEQEARAAEKRRVVKIAVALALAFVIAAGAAAFAWKEWRLAAREKIVAQAARAEEQAQILQSQQLLAQANGNKALADQYAAEAKKAEVDATALRQQANVPSANRTPANSVVREPQPSLPDAIRMHDDAQQAQIADLEARLNSKQKENPAVTGQTPPPLPPEPREEKPKPAVEEPGNSSPPAEKSPSPAGKSLAELAETASRQFPTNPQLGLALALYAAQKSQAAGKEVDPLVKAILYKGAGPERTINTHKLLAQGANTPVAIGFGPDGNTVGVKDAENLCMVTVADGQSRCVLTNAGGLMGWSPDKAEAVVGGSFGLEMVDTAHRGVQQSIGSGVRNVHCLAFGPNGIIAYVTGTSGEVRFWNKNTGQQSKAAGPLGKNKTEIFGMTFVPGGQVLATGMHGAVGLWSYPGGLQVTTRSMSDTADEVRQIVFSHDGKRMAAAAMAPRNSLAPASVEVWDTTSGTPIYYNRGATEIVALSLSPDGSQLVRSQAGSVILESVDKGGMKMPAGKPGQTVTLTLESVNRSSVTLSPGIAAFSPTGNILAVALNDSVMIYPALPSALIAHVRTKSRKLTTDECKQYLGLAACPQ